MMFEVYEHCTVQKWSWCSARTQRFLFCSRQQSDCLWISPVWQNVCIFYTS